MTKFYQLGYLFFYFFYKKSVSRKSVDFPPTLNIVEPKLTIILFTSKKEYIEHFQNELYDKCNEEVELEDYLNSQLCNLEKLTANIS